ncbi:hypothetical protein [Sphingomonas sp. YL-JM2C]
MTVLTDQEVGSQYAELMLEIRSRLREIEMQLNISDISTAKRQQVFAAEYAYFQLRRITELVSMAILIAHNPTEEFRAGNLLKEWNPDTLLKLIGKLRPAAFPQRGIDGGDPSGERTFIAAPLVNTEARDRICKIYTTAADKLHVGAFKSFMRRKREYNFNDIQASWEYLVDLLDEHIIFLPDGRIAYTKLGYPDAESVEVKWITLPGEA